MKRVIAASCLAASTIAPLAATAQQPTAEPTSPHTLTGNVTVINDYRFRGISQTFRRPAIQGGFDYAHASGLYVGNWNSNVSGLTYPNGAGIEMDFYGGYKRTFGDFGFDVGTIYYYYPSAEVETAAGRRSFNNHEVYVGGSWRFITAKVFYSLSNYFGLDGALAQSFFENRTQAGVFLPDNGNSRGSTYYDLTASYEVIPKLTLSAHVGRAQIRNYTELRYWDYRLGGTYDWKGWLLGAAVVGTNADRDWYYNRSGTGTTRSTGNTTLLVSLGRTF